MTVLANRDVPEHAYHADNLGIDQPTLSRSVAHLLLERSPAHAKAAHPKLNGIGPQRTDDRKFDLGNAAHALLLQGRNTVVVVTADDWRTKAAKETRDAAYEAGLTPLLEKDWWTVEQMVAAIREQLPAFAATPELLVDGQPEQTIVWEEDGVWCRARPDWLHDDHSAIEDVKTTTRSANPESYGRTLFSMGYDLQASLYCRGVERLTGTRPEFRFVVCETTPPFAVSVLALAPDAMALADAKVDRAIGLWRECLTSGEWPAYPLRVCYAEAPPWAEAQWLERVAREEMA